MSNFATMPRRSATARERYLVIGATLTALALAVGLLGLLYSPYAPTKVDLLHRLAPPRRRTCSVPIVSGATC